MAELPIILAAPSANCGKTHLACRLVSLLGAQALKITRFHRESHCPVHGINEVGVDNCDGCAPAPAGFELIDDPAVLNTPGKDTHRLAQSGADPVLWLRAAPHVFQYALGAAARRFDPSRPLVIEGNSAATLPGFAGRVVLLWPQSPRGVKASVLPSLKRADVLVLVEAESVPKRRWPKTLLSAMGRAGIQANDLPEPVWFCPNWWTEQGRNASDKVLQRLGFASSRESPKLCE